MKKIILFGMVVMVLILGAMEMEGYNLVDASVNSTATNAEVFMNLTYGNITRIGGILYVDSFMNYHIYNLSQKSIEFANYTNTTITYTESRNLIFVEQFNLTEDLEGLRSIKSQLIDSAVNLSSDSNNFTKIILSSVSNPNGFNISFAGKVNSCDYIGTMVFVVNSGASTNISSTQSCDNATKFFTANITDIESGTNTLRIDSELPSITIDTPANNTAFTTTTNDINGTASDDVLINAMWYNFQNTSTMELLIANSTPQICDDTFCDFNFSEAAFPIENEALLNVFVNQSDGRESILTLNFSASTDNSPPSIPIPAELSGVQGATSLNFKINVTDNADQPIDMTCNYNITDSNDVVQMDKQNQDCDIEDNFIGINSQSYIFRIDATDLSNNTANESSSFSISVSGGGGSSGGGGGGGGQIGKLPGQSCTTNEECTTGICDLEIGRGNKTSSSYQICVTSTCGNNLCATEPIKETGSSCQVDCRAFRGPTGEISPVILYGGIGTALMFIYITQESRIKKLVGRRRKKR